MSHDMNRDKAANLELHEAEKASKELFNDIKFTLDDLIETVDRIINIRVVKNGALRKNTAYTEDSSENTLESQEVESKYFRPRIEKACATIHRNLHEARIGLRTLRAEVDSNKISDQADQNAISELDSLVLQYKDLFDKQIKPYFFSGLRLMTPSLEILQGGVDHRGLPENIIPKKHMEYLEDALNEFLGLPDDNWAGKFYLYQSADRDRVVANEYLELLHRLSQEYSNDADLACLDLETLIKKGTKDHATLEYLDDFHSKLTAYLNNRYGSFDLVYALHHEETYKELVKDLIYSFFNAPAQTEETQLPEFIKNILILDRLRFFAQNADEDYLRSKTTKHSFSEERRLSADEMNQFQGIYNNCVRYISTHNPHEEHSMKKQDLLNPEEVKSLGVLALNIQTETEKLGIGFTVADPSSSFNSYIKNIDDELQLFLSDNRHRLMKVNYDDDTLVDLMEDLFIYTKRPEIIIKDTVKLILLMTLSFKRNY